MEQPGPIGVFAAYATSRGRALVDRELYLPKSWTEDRDRCRAAKVPDEREFHTKGELAKAMVLRALASPLPIAWVTADSAYGQEGRFRRLLEQSGVGYVLAVPKSQFSVGCPRIDWLFSQAPAEAWERVSCGNGAKGPRVYDWAAIRLPAVAEYDCQDETQVRQRWALARRSPSRPDEIAYCLACSQLDTTVEQLVRIAGMCWTIEECFQATKNECGPDQYEVRRYTGWMRAHHPGHARPRLPGRDGCGIKGGCRNGSRTLVDLTVAEIRRLLAAGRPHGPHPSRCSPRVHALNWSTWRRQRQAVARRCHHQRRLRTI